MDKKDIEKEIFITIKKNSGLKDETPIDKNTLLLTNLSFDSVRIVQLITELEQKFKISISDEEMSTIETAGDVVKVIDRHLQN